MILDDFLRCVFGSFNKVVQNWKESPILSLSPHKKKRANKHHHHQIMEVADIAIAPLKEFVRDSARLVKKCTKPDRREFTLIASKTAFGASSRSSYHHHHHHHRSLFLCVLSPHFSRFFGGNQIHIYIATLSRGSHQKTFSLHLLQNTTGFIMFGFVGFFVKLVL